MKVIEVAECSLEVFVNKHPEVMGKQVSVKYELTDTGGFEWFEGIITTYNCLLYDRKVWCLQSGCLLVK